MNKYNKYILLVIVAVISFGAAFTFPTQELLKTIIASPGVIALFGVLYQLFRDHNAHERNIELLHRQQIFNIGATSHMANVAFDKHVEFAEKYMSEIHHTVETLYRKGPTEDALEHAATLSKLKQEYAAWLTEDINKSLFPFEQALRNLGAKEHFIKTTIGDQSYEEQRAKSIDYVFKEFDKILHIDKDNEQDQTIATEAIKRKIREILDLEDLVQLRKQLIKTARRSINT